MKAVLKLGWSFFAVGVLVGLWNMALTIGAANPVALVAEVALMIGVTLVAVYALYWIWFREG